MTSTDIGRAWRALRTGLAFAAFGAGALFLAFCVFPLLRLIPGDRRRREFRMKYLVHLAFRCFVTIMTGLGLIRGTRSGTESLRRPGARLVVANHPTLIDVVLLIACMPQADCVVKRKHWRNWITRGVVAGAGYIPARRMARRWSGRAIDARAPRLPADRALPRVPGGAGRGRVLPADRRARTPGVAALSRAARGLGRAAVAGPGPTAPAAHAATIGSSRCRSSTASRCGPAGRRTSRSGSMGASISRPWSRPGAARSCSAPMWGASTSCAGALLAEGILNAFLSRPPDDAPGGSDP